MRLYKRGAYWWCSFPWRGQTVRRSTRCTTRTAALLTAQRWERERADPDHAAAASATFGGAVTAFLADLERSAKPKDTRDFYRRKCGTLVRHIGADRPLSEVTAQLVDRFIAAREAEGVAFDDAGAPTRTVTANTIHKELVALRQVLKRAKRRGELRRDLSEILPVGYSPRYEPRKVSLTLEQAGALCRALPPHRAAAVAFALATTARYAEVFRARSTDLYPMGEVRLRGTKTAGSARSISVPGFALPLLDFAIEKGNGRFFGDLLFNPWPNSHRDIAAACRRINAPEVTWNDLRRTMATWLLEGGVSTYLVSKMLGHTTTKMVETVYGKPRDEALGDLMAKQAGAIPAITMGGGRDGSEAIGRGGREVQGDPEAHRGASGDHHRSNAISTVRGKGASDSAPRSDFQGDRSVLVQEGGVVLNDVRLPYVPAAEQAPPQPTAAFQIAGNTEQSGGLPGDRTLDQGIKSPVTWGAWYREQYGEFVPRGADGSVPVREVNAKTSEASIRSDLGSGLTGQAAVGRRPHTPDVTPADAPKEPAFSPDALRWALEEHRSLLVGRAR